MSESKVALVATSTKMGPDDDPSHQAIAAFAKADEGPNTAQHKDTITYDNSTVKKTKSRYGCRGCKARRLKCDETHPACLQCLRRGRECPGYARDFKFSDKHERLRFGGKDKSRNRKRKASPETAAPAECMRPPSCHGTATVHISEPTPKIEQQESQDPIDELPFGSAEPHVDMMELIFAETPAMDVSEPCGGNGSMKPQGTATPTTNGIFGNQSQDQAKDDSNVVPNQVEPQREQDDQDRSEENAEEVSRTPRCPSNSQRRRASNSLVQRAQSRISNTPVDLPTTLIEYWFTHVCGMWSAYDSASNPNRQLALNNCFSSESVFYALQSMSAACLVDSLPHLKPVLASTSGNALAAINRDMTVYYDLDSTLAAELPTDLLLSIFAMATSLCWTDTKQLGEPLVTGARTILMRYRDTGGGPESKSQKELSHFHHALKYTEMLLNFVSSESAYGQLETLRQRHRTRLRHVIRWQSDQEDEVQDMSNDSTSFGPEKDEDHDSILHPWTGISQAVQEQFGLAMALCRDHHTRRTYSSVQSANALCESLCDIEVARELSQRLIQSSFGSDLEEGYEMPLSLHTGDVSTPVSHLLDTADAYRLAALLQLYITFPDLEIRLDESSPSSVDPSMDGCGEMERSQALTTLTLLLVDVLERIPPESGTRCIQPVLYVSAATGLRFDTPVMGDLSVPSLTQCTIEVSRARKFIVDRLSTLLRSLPPRPIGVALNLIKAIWSEYDYGQSTAVGGHWMDVMMKTGLQTLFG